MTNQEQLGLEPYRFEPMLSQEEIDRIRNSAESQTVHVSLDDWCYCDNCGWLFIVLRPAQEYFTYMETSPLPVMPNSDENVCFR
jgi:hypothetical protein